MEQRSAALVQAMLSLESQDECERFLKDILTVPEMIELSNRWLAMLLLDEGLTHRQVRGRLGISLTTAARAAGVLRSGEGSCKAVKEKLRERDMLGPLLENYMKDQ